MSIGLSGAAPPPVVGSHGIGTVAVARKPRQEPHKLLVLMGKEHWW